VEHRFRLQRVAGTSACAAAVIFLLVGCKGRPPAPPSDLEVGPPWGVVQAADVADLYTRKGGTPPAIERTADGQRRWPILLLAGTGSRTVFAAGLLSGWSASGERPRFQVVTGVGPGATMATFAFLGPAYDEVSRAMSVVETRDVYRRLGLITELNEGASFSPKPLRNRLEERIDDEVLAAVAAAHADGRRLYVGTTNLDTNEFVIWDMGAIASSDHPDRRERYIDVLMASMSPPPTYPPVYIEVDAVNEKGKPFAHAHVDGGVKQPAFMRSFMLPPRSDDLSEIQIEIYMILGDQVSGRSAYAMPVKQNLSQLTQANVLALRETATQASLYRINAQAARRGLKVRFVAIPGAVESLPQPGIFEPDKLQALFDAGYDIGASDETWSDLEHLLELFGLLEEAVS